MGRRGHPPLTPTEVRGILIALGFVKLPSRQTSGSHEQYERAASEEHPRRLVTLDTGPREFWEAIIKSMIRQSGFSREQFYGATKATARKIGLRS